MAANLSLFTLNSLKALFCTPQVLLILLMGNVDFIYFFFIIPLSEKYFKIIIIKIMRSGPRTFHHQARQLPRHRHQSWTSKALEDWKGRRKLGKVMQEMAMSVKSLDTPRAGPQHGGGWGEGGEPST